jgi:hypothetical protein
VFDLDRFSFDVECPRCKFSLGILYRDARLRNVLICRGCKANIQLDDHMNQCRKARAQVARLLKELEETISSFGKLGKR